MLHATHRFVHPSPFPSSKLPSKHHNDWRFIHSVLNFSTAPDSSDINKISHTIHVTYALKCLLAIALRQYTRVCFIQLFLWNYFLFIKRLNSSGTPERMCKSASEYFCLEIDKWITILETQNILWIYEIINKYIEYPY